MKICATFPIWQIGVELRGLIPDEYDIRLGEIFGRKAAELLLEGQSSVVVILPDDCEPVYENLLIKTIADVLRPKDIA